MPLHGRKFGKPRSHGVVQPNRRSASTRTVGLILSMAGGSPIYFRLGTGSSSGLGGPSDIQSGDPINDHYPFDTRDVNNGQGGTPNAFRLIPLLCSTHGMDANAHIFYGGTSGSPYNYQGNPNQKYSDPILGTAYIGAGSPTGLRLPASSRTTTSSSGNRLPQNPDFVY